VTSRLVIALIAGAALAIPLGLIVPWMLAALPSDSWRWIFYQFAAQQNFTIAAWLLLSLAFFVVPSDARWRWILSGLAATFLVVPIWTIAFLRGTLAAEFATNGGPTIVFAVVSAVIGLAAMSGLWRIEGGVRMRTFSHCANRAEK